MYLYRKVPKFSDARKLCCSLPKIQTKRPNLSVYCQKDANGMANSEDPDQTAPSSLIWVSGSALFAQTCLSENLGSLRYMSLTTRLFCIFRGFRIVGPFVVMIYKMVVGDLRRFLIIYLVFLIGFSQCKFSLVYQGM